MFVKFPNFHPRRRSLNICSFISFLLAIGDPPNVILVSNKDLISHVSYYVIQVFLNLICSWPFWSSLLHYFTTSLLRSFIPSFLRSFFPLFLRAFVPSCLLAFLPSCLRVFVHLFDVSSFIRSFILSFVYLFIHLLFLISHEVQFVILC